MLTEIKTQLDFIAFRGSEAEFFLFAVDLFQQIAGGLVGMGYGVCHSAVVAGTISPALSDDPVANQILIETHDAVFVLFSPAYDQLCVTV